jgi:Co/Zn/Cd efflux system component
VFEHRTVAFSLSLTDALTSIQAIVALLVDRSYGWLWADPAMGVVGALVGYMTKGFCFARRRATMH